MIARQRATLDRVQKNNEKAKVILDQLRDDIDHELKKVMVNAVTDFTQDIIRNVIDTERYQKDGVAVRLTFEICERTRAFVDSIKRGDER